MSAIRYEPREDHWEGDEEQGTLVIPGRPPRRRLGRAGVLLITLLVGAIGFYVGVRVEKGQIGSSSTAAAGTSAPTGAPAGFSGRSGASALNRFAGSGAAGGSSFGTVASLDGRTIYVKTVSGNTVKVRLVSATKVSKRTGRQVPGRLQSLWREPPSRSCRRRFLPSRNHEVRDLRPPARLCNP